MRDRKQSIPKWTAQNTKQIVKSGRSSANLEVIEQMWKVIPFLCKSFSSTMMDRRHNLNLIH